MPVSWGGGVKLEAKGHLERGFLSYFLLPGDKIFPFSTYPDGGLESIKALKIRGLSLGLVEKRQENEQRSFLKVTITGEQCRTCNYVLEKVEL